MIDVVFGNILTVLMVQLQKVLGTGTITLALPPAQNGEVFMSRSQPLTLQTDSDMEDRRKMSRNFFFVFSRTIDFQSFICISSGLKRSRPSGGWVAVQVGMRIVSCRGILLYYQTLKFGFSDLLFSLYYGCQ
jgi:hypothetical protein